VYNNHTHRVNWIIQQDENNLNRYNFGGAGSSAHFYLIANKWQHLVAIKDTNSIMVYVDGNLIDEHDDIPISYDNPPNLVIGAWYNSGNLTRYWKGDFDDIRIYNRVLSYTEIEILYQENGWE
jgi:hypothetical protein